MRRSSILPSLFILLTFAIPALPHTAEAKGEDETLCFEQTKSLSNEAKKSAFQACMNDRNAKNEDRQDSTILEDGTTTHWQTPIQTSPSNQEGQQ